VPGSHVPEKRTFSRRATLRALAGLSVLAAAGLGTGLVIISQNKAGAGTGTPSSHPLPALRATAAYTYAGHRSPVYGVVWEPTTQAGRSMLRVASAGRDVQLWDALNGGNSKIYSVYQGEVFSLAWCHSTTKIVSGNLDGTAHIWIAATAQYVNRLIGHSAAIRGVAWARDGVHIATASNDMQVGLWTLDTQHNDAASPIFLQNHGNIVYAVSFSDDSSYLASSSADRTVMLWQVPGGAHFATYTGHTGDVRAVAFAPGSSRSAGLLIASGGEDKTAQVWTWSAQSQAFHLLARYTGHNATINTLAWSPAGSLIASGDNMGQVHIWHSKTAERLLTFQAHRDAVNGLAWSPDGRYLASAGQDQLVHVFRVS
jgi:WD40 repeat protein